MLMYIFILRLNFLYVGYLFILYKTTNNMKFIHIKYEINI